MDVLALGELLIDFVQTGRTEQGAPVMAANPGGAPLNYLGALAKYGCSAGMIGKVGADAFGGLLVQTLARHHIAWLGKSTEEAFTTLAFVSLDDRGERSFSFARKPGADTRLCMEDLPYREIEKTRAFHFGTLSLTDEPAKSATMDAVRFARANGVTVTFDPNYRAMLWKSPEDARQAMLWGFSHADIIKAGADELELAFCKPWRDAADELMANGARIVFVTMGAEGCFFASRHATGFTDAFHVKTVDTTGAGDIFFGAAMSRILQSGVSPEQINGEQMQQAVRFGAAAAALSTKKPGGLPSIASENEVLALLQN